LQADGVQTKVSNKSMDQLKVEIFNSNTKIGEEKDIIFDLIFNID